MLHICNIQLHLPYKLTLHIGLTYKWSYITPVNILKNGVTAFFTPFLEWNYGSPKNLQLVFLCAHIPCFPLAFSKAATSSETSEPVWQRFLQVRAAQKAR